MTPARDDAKRNLLNVLKAIVAEGSLRDWLVAMVLIAIPITFAFSLSAVLDAIIHFLLTPIIWLPILKILHIDSLTYWSMGWIKIGSFLDALTSICLNIILLFAFARYVRRFI